MCKSAHVICYIYKVKRKMHIITCIDGKKTLQNLTPVLFYVTLKVLATAVWQEIEGICIRKEEKQFSLFGDNMLVCTENLREPIK